MKYWQRWLRQPQTVWLRKALFQLHLWSAIGLGLYVLLISVTGSVLVYRNELYRAATPAPTFVTPSGAPLTDAQLKGAATRLYPGYTVYLVSRPRNAELAVSVDLQRRGDRKNRLFNPYTGADLGEAVPLGVRMVSGLLSLHDDLLGGKTGRKVNGFAAVLVLVIIFTGIVVWWPGIRTWRRSLTVPRKAGWQRVIWGLHSMLGFWGFGILLLFAISGSYRARVSESASRGVAALIAIHPIDLVVADVHRVHVGRRITDLQSVLESCRFESFVPPQKAVFHSRAGGFGDGSIEIVNDGLLRLAQCGIGVRI
jgi:uncharacterized iron-regulated membrane protein